MSLLQTSDIIIFGVIVSFGLSCNRPEEASEAKFISGAFSQVSFLNSEENVAKFPNVAALRAWLGADKRSAADFREATAENNVKFNTENRKGFQTTQVRCPDFQPSTDPFNYLYHEISRIEKYTASLGSIGSEPTRNQENVAQDDLTGVSLTQNSALSEFIKQEASEIFDILNSLAYPGFALLRNNNFILGNMINCTSPGTNPQLQSLRQFVYGQNNGSEADGMPYFGNLSVQTSKYEEVLLEGLLASPEAKREFDDQIKRTLRLLKLRFGILKAKWDSKSGGSGSGQADTNEDSLLIEDYLSKISFIDSDPNSSSEASAGSDTTSFSLGLGSKQPQAEANEDVGSSPSTQINTNSSNGETEEIGSENNTATSESNLGSTEADKIEMRRIEKFISLTSRETLPELSDADLDSLYH